MNAVGIEFAKKYVAFIEMNSSVFTSCWISGIDTDTSLDMSPDISNKVNSNDSP